MLSIFSKTLENSTTFHHQKKRFFFQGFSHPFSKQKNLSEINSEFTIHLIFYKIDFYMLFFNDFDNIKHCFMILRLLKITTRF